MLIESSSWHRHYYAQCEMVLFGYDLAIICKFIVFQANISLSILVDMEMHKRLWKCITETNVMENIKSGEI